MKRSIMQKHFRIIVVMILMSQIFLAPLTASEAQARTQVTVTFAASGLVCGIFFFLQFTLRSSELPEDSYDTNALLDRGEEGWNLRVPSLTMTPLPEIADIRRPEPTRGMMAMELLKIRF